MGKISKGSARNPPTSKKAVGASLNLEHVVNGIKNTPIYLYFEVFKYDPVYIHVSRAYIGVPDGLKRSTIKIQTYYIKLNVGQQD